MTNYVNGVSQHVYQIAGGGLDAGQELTGPGSTAYDVSGPYSSYAYENYEGGIYEHNVTNHLGYSDYSYYYSTTTYKQGDGSYYYRSFGRYEDRADPGYVSHAYNQPSSITYYSHNTYIVSGGVDNIHHYFFNQYNYSDGSYLRSTTYIAFEDGPHGYIPGSGNSSFGTISGPPGGYGYSAGYGYYGYDSGIS